MIDAPLYLRGVVAQMRIAHSELPLMSFSPTPHAIVAEDGACVRGLGRYAKDGVGADRLVEHHEHSQKDKVVGARDQAG